MPFVAYWVFPIISGLIWLATLLGLFLHWVIDTNERRYSSMEATQTIAYISDIGASELKPLFVVGCVLTTIFLDASFISDRLLRHKGRLVPNTSLGQKVLSGLSIFFAFVGTIGLTFLSGFDTAHYPRLHDVFLLLFILGYLLSAIFICWGFQRLGKKYRQHRILRFSFWVKLTFVLVEFALAIGFGVTRARGDINSSAILEWVVALIFTFYVFSFVIDLWPAVATRDGGRYDLRPMTTNEMQEAIRRGSFADAAALALPRTTDDSQRTLADSGSLPTVIPAAAAAAAPPSRHKPQSIADSL
ncbi:putative frag1 dram sfk1 family protein [Rosellinia necatrix]|uniref:Putative frag1 dram sfk1 family protein n=1 Tax=Rosellinia necatrix TaxID=77044 RepID=A0A1W2TLJ1_ROSNE|nr:putative frag1 dram sfk1 family protein [Rosellinia necatrix]